MCVSVCACVRAHYGRIKSHSENHVSKPAAENAYIFVCACTHVYMMHVHDGRSQPSDCWLQQHKGGACGGCEILNVGFCFIASLVVC